MQNECANGTENCYFVCRKRAARQNAASDALSSRAGAAERLNVSESSLRDYETGLTPVPVDVVVRMADLYGAPELMTGYCKNECPIGRLRSRTISDEVKGIEEVTVSLLYHMQEVKTKETTKVLLRIAADGKISEREKGDLREVVEALENVTRDINDLRLLMDKKGGTYGEHD